MIVKRVGPVSFARVAGTLYAVLGVFIGCIVSLAALVGAASSNSARGAGLGALLGVGAIVVFPILYGALGFLFTLIGAWLYNLVAGWVGGVEVELQ